MIKAKKVIKAGKERGHKQNKKYIIQTLLPLLS